ncbi:MAG TPA: tetratricopeptide repeat protein, partial [Vicinamibacterales bacterium]|nr:tetratricopeptide repeat protein [Vicinamibacterales bacterium]
RRVPPGGLVHASYIEHLDVARQLLDWVDHPEGDPDVQLWYRVVTAWVFSQRLLVAAVHHLDEVERVLGHDANALFDEGTFHELLGSPSVQGLVTSRATVRGGMPTVGSARYHFGQAERRFTRVLELDPGFVEARVRLGRVQGALGRPDRAAEQLEGAAPLATSQVVRYYGFLFLGRAREALGDDDNALVAYQQAALLYPNAQSALFGIGRLARAAGAYEASLAATDRVLALPRDEQARPDPWWVYHAGIGRDAVPLVATLHARVAGLSR